MDNALLALYVWLSLALLLVGGAGLTGDVPARVSLLRATLALALHVVLSLGLAAYIAWRRLRWVPVEGEPIVNSQEAGGPPYPPTYYRSSGCGWRWTYCGVTYTAEDYMPEDYTPGDYLFAWEERTTLWVDPRDPSRLLPSTWGLRLLSYLTFGGMSAYCILRLWELVP